MTTNRDLDRQLDSWFEARATSTPPADMLERALVKVAVTRQRPGWLVSDHWRSTDGRARLASRPARVGVVVVGLLVVALAASAVGAWLTRPSDVIVPPVPAPSASIVPTPSPDAQTPSPTEPLTEVPGGGMVLVRDIARDANGAPVDTVHGFGPGSYEVSLVDPGTGARTLLGSVPYDPHTGYVPELRFAADGHHAMITDGRGKLWTLDSPTEASKEIAFACCEQPGVVGWVFSPSGDRMAGLAQSEKAVPGQPGITSVADALVISNVDGSGLRTLQLPDGADTGAAGTTVSWAPDETAVVMAGCRPCNYADPGKKPKHLTHSHIYIVPLDGSPVRELLDETAEGLFNPAWSADGATIIVGRNDCPSDEIQPFCAHGRVTIATVSVADGRQTILADAPNLATGPWVSSKGSIAYGVQGHDAPDPTGGVYVLADNPTRLSDGFDPRWSPDGEWLLFTDPDGSISIVSADGGRLRSIGAYGAAGW